MAWSFRKRLKLLPGLYLNFSKEGVSTTFGTKGMSITTGPKGKTMNVGLPGTGLYSRRKISDTVNGADVPHVVSSNIDIISPSEVSAEKVCPAVQNESDPLLAKVRRIVSTSPAVSPSQLQEKLSISYARACQLLKIVKAED